MTPRTPNPRWLGGNVQNWQFEIIDSQICRLPDCRPLVPGEWVARSTTDGSRLQGSRLQTPNPQVSECRHCWLKPQVNGWRDQQLAAQDRLERCETVGSQIVESQSQMSGWRQPKLVSRDCKLPEGKLPDCRLPIPGERVARSRIGGASL